jgi:hypothetical protein
VGLAWTAGSVRARLLARRRLGRAGAEELLGARSLAEALRALGPSPYGRLITPGMSAPEAQRAVVSATVWHLRVLAGWLPSGAQETLRGLAAWAEMVNVLDRYAYLAGAPHAPPFELGRLATAWTRLRGAGSPDQLREGLAHSRWGDPGADGPAAAARAMRIAWAERLLAVAPAARPWVLGALALEAARHVAFDEGAALRAADRRPLPGLGDGWRRARTLEELRKRLPKAASWALAGVEDATTLWTAEARWWGRVEADATRLVVQPRGPLTVLGAVALLAVDAWRTCAALEVIAHREAGREVLDAAG